MTVKTGLRDIVLPRDGTGVCMRRGTTRYRGPLGGGGGIGGMIVIHHGEIYS